MAFNVNEFAGPKIRWCKKFTLSSKYRHYKRVADATVPFMCKGAQVYVRNNRSTILW